MPAQREMEIFSAGYLVCDETVTRIGVLACAWCEITVPDTADR